MSKGERIKEMEAFRQTERRTRNILTGTIGVLVYVTLSAETIWPISGIGLLVAAAIMTRLVGREGVKLASLSSEMGRTFTKRLYAMYAVWPMLLVLVPIFYKASLPLIGWGIYAGILLVLACFHRVTRNELKRADGEQPLRHEIQFIND